MSAARFPVTVSLWRPMEGQGPERAVVVEFQTQAGRGRVLLADWLEHRRRARVRAEMVVVPRGMMRCAGVRGGGR